MFLSFSATAKFLTSGFDHGWPKAMKKYMWVAGCILLSVTWCMVLMTGLKALVAGEGTLESQGKESWSGRNWAGAEGTPRRATRKRAGRKKPPCLPPQQW
jgi:hypothetical protein